MARRRRTAPRRSGAGGSDSASFLPHPIPKSESQEQSPPTARRQPRRSDSVTVHGPAKERRRTGSNATQSKRSELKPAGGSTRREKAASVPSQNTKGKTNDERPTGVVPQTLSRGRSTHRRRPGSHRADVRGQDSSVRQLPHFSPQYDIRTLRSLGRNPETASYRNVNQSKQDALKVIPLGGLCEIGKNMTVYEYGSDMIIVDVGVAFPEEHQPGIDSVIPDMSYVFENRAKLRGVFLTHGHEDHIGAISWLLRDIDVPVYGRPLTIGLVDYKLEDKGVRGRSRLLHPVEYGEIVKAGVFGVEFINVNHSIADAASLALHTPAGVVIHSGDFKIDYTPVFGEPIDLGRFAELGNQGVLLFNCESTNIERRGSTPSEQKVGEAFSKHFAKAPGRIIVATFSSNVSRVQQVISAAEKHGRHVALMGRSMLNVFRAARRLGYLQIQPNTLIEADDIDRHAPEKVVIITTGSQGEPTSGLTRMAYSEHRSIEIQPGDMVIISATPIPGNEKSLYRVIDELYKRRATVVYSDLADIHVSGHAYRDEIELMHRLIRPRYFIPGHGEYRHLHIHAEVAHALGQSWDTIYLLNNGDILECTPESARIAGYTSASAVLIDGSPTGTVNQEILEQRQSLSDDGVVAVAIAVDSKRRRLVGEPQIMTRGFIYEEDSRSVERDCIREIRNYAEKALNSGQPLMTMLDAPRLRERIRDQLFQKTGRRPVVLIQILDVTA